MDIFANDEQIDLLLKTLSNTKRVTYLFGAGFSMSIGNHSISWQNWINKGLDFLNQNQKDEICSSLTISNTNSLINIAGLLFEKLGSINKFDDFMQSTIETIVPIQQDLIEALKLIVRNGDLISTTNYDLVIEKATSLKPITYNNAGEILKILKEESKNKILHLHGVYSRDYQINDIIATQDQYDEIVKNQGAQFVQNLLSINPIIIVGCGGTVDDPNLKNFLQFSTKYLSLDVPYFYLHCKKDSLDGLPDKIIPICYGDSYEELPTFMLNVTMTRIRKNLNIKDICRVNPYIKTSCSNSAYSRMHYAAKYLDFIGRKDELSKLDDFLRTEDDFSWWMVTGEAGMGKSRLLLEWLYNLPSDWFGFFANINADFSKYKPFSNTIIVLDYVAGREKQCSSLIQQIIEIFKNSIYKIRIILVERHYEPDKKDWFYNLAKNLKPVDKIFFENSAYSNPITPLEIGKLKYEEEKEYIKNYLEKYVNELNTEDLKEKYLKNINISIRKIHKSFKKMLKGIFHRPLYLSIFIEVWIDKSGEFSIKNSEELLECFLEKEEQRWLEKFNNDRNILNAYLKLLAIACVTEFLCVNEDNLHYQGQSNILCKYLLSNEETGRRKISLTDLFIVTKPNNDNPTMSDYIIEPLYPDIIREFIVLYYIGETESKMFAQTARYVSIVQLSMFLAHALDDFPKNKQFVEMLMAEPNEDCEYFDYFLGLIMHMLDLQDYDYIINNLLNTSQQVTEDFGIYELYTWLKLAEVQSYKLYKKEISVDDYMKRANKFTDFINKKFNLPNVKEHSLDIFEIWFEGLYNNEKTKQADEYLISIKNIINKIPEDYDFFANAATVYCECYQKMLILHARKNDYNSCKKDIEIIEEYLNILPNDEDIYNSYIKTVSDYILKLCKSQEFNRIKEFLSKLKDLYEHYNDVKIAECLSIIYANFFSLRINECIEADDDLDENDKILKQYKIEIETLLNKYPDNEHIVESFVSIKSNLLMALCLHEHEVRIDDKLLQTIREYYNKWKNNIDIIEGLGKLIYIKALSLISQEKTNQVKTLIKQLENIEIESRPIYKEYISSNDELKTWIKMLKNGIKLQNVFREFMY